MNQPNVEFEGLILRELGRAWHNYVARFKWNTSGIQAPNLRITEASIAHIGQWDTKNREMSFSRHLVTKRPWSEVLEVLKHEMAHQYVHEILHVNDENPHGSAFKSVCKINHIDAAPRGLPGIDKISTTNHIVEKIRHLLELADNTAASEAEAQAAAEAAHKMMFKYNIDLQATNEDRGYKATIIGEMTGRIQQYQSQIANILSEYYFVEIIWVSAYDPRDKSKGHELEVSGTKENVESAEYIYEFLSKAALSAWEKKFADPVFKLQLQRDFTNTYGVGNAPTTPRGFTVSARSNFLAGFIQGFASQLKQVAYKEKEAGLVLAKDIALEAFYRERYPHIRRLQSGGMFRNSNMRNTGFNEGRSLQLKPGIKAPKKFVPLLGK